MRLNNTGGPKVLSALFALVGVSLILLGGLVWANWPPPPLPTGLVVDHVVVEKGARRLSLYSKGKLLASYSVALGRSPIGPKEREGDRRTPEGHYFIDRHNPNSSFHLALHVSYPSPPDLERAKTAGYAPGGDIMIHGIRRGIGWIGRGHRIIDWTAGCIAVSDAEIEQIYHAVPDGTPVDLRP